MPGQTPMDVAVNRYGNNGILYMPSAFCTKRPANLVPNQMFVGGTILGEIAAQPGTFKAYAGSAIGSPAALTPTLATAPTGGSLAGGQTVFAVFTWKNGAGETVKSTEASIAIPAGTSTNTVTVTAPQALPAGSTGIGVYVGTATGANYLVGYAPSNTMVVGSLAAGTQAPPGASTAVAATDGSQVPKGVLPYSCATDGTGTVFLVGNANLFQAGQGGLFQAGEPCVEMIVGGCDFYITDLVNLDAAAITAGFGRVEKATIGSPYGLLRLP